ncbi:3-deoxy-D-manno-octulosonic acid transferase [Haloferula chungangensis]|uniref:3-deoxy-D-manno-octulosonic acid transferase n=1 Tax=Haloferula chungangensis TaxID=1048331 RepID=A0ABW2L694_9BACT
MSPTLLLYRVLLPIYVLVALPGWLMKTARRGGFGSGLGERGSFYGDELEFEPCGAVHVHAVSVGETLLAMKLIRAWRVRKGAKDFVLAVGTATGHAVAVEAKMEGVRVVYQPVDFRFMVRRYLDRFQPSQIVLVEGEMWPNLMLECARRGVPTRLVNARMSPRSKRRYRKMAPWVRPIFSKLDWVAVQEAEDAEVWKDLGVDEVKVTGSLKFDPGAGGLPTPRAEFVAMIDACAAGRPVVLAASTHDGEESLIGRAVREAGGFYLCVPRHAERRAEVREALRSAGFDVVLRSEFRRPDEPGAATLVVDSTGELRDWTASADVVVIGKSFLGIGGQNPAEAISAGKPLVFGPHMENFEPLATRLVECGGARRVADESELAQALKEVMADPDGTAAAKAVLDGHRGATGRILDHLDDE